jgi:uncharacterized protein YjbI with pentapeptide repeats
MKKLYLLITLVGIVTSLISACSKGVGGDVKTAEDSVISADYIIEQLIEGKSIKLANKRITGALDFTKAGLPNSNIAVSAVYVNEEVSFCNCVFDDSVSTYWDDNTLNAAEFTVFLKNVSFQECVFRKGINMRQTDFRGRFDFDVSKVENLADFSGARFGNGVSFRAANFNGDVFFVSCVFEGRANFFKVFFRNSVLMQYVRFYDIAMFSDTYFYGGVDISKIFAGASIDFTNSKFFANLTMSNSDYLGDVRLVNCKFGKNFAFLGNKVIGTLNLNKSQIEGAVNLSDNILLMSPEVREYTKGDSCSIIQKDNKTVNLIVKQII